MSAYVKSLLLGLVVAALGLMTTGCAKSSTAPDDTDNPVIHSLEFGHTTSHSDYCAQMNLSDDFGNGFLFSIWTKITQTIEPGGTRGNMNILRIYGDNWGLICLDGNIGQNADGTARYNANFMLDLNSTYIGDFCTYYSLPTENISMDDANGWVWVAWQVVVNADKSMTLRQWLKFGVDGIVIPAGYWNDTDVPGEEILIAGTTSVEGWNIPDTFDPSKPRSFRIGDDNTWSGVNTPSNSYLYHARLYARTTKPTINELNAIALATFADTGAWGDWMLEWKDGAADLTDESGHGNDLSLQPGGILYMGAQAPDLL